MAKRFVARRGSTKPKQEELTQLQATVAGVLVPLRSEVRKYLASNPHHKATSSPKFRSAKQYLASVADVAVARIDDLTQGRSIGFPAAIKIAEAIGLKVTFVRDDDRKLSTSCFGRTG